MEIREILPHLSRPFPSHPFRPTIRDAIPLQPYRVLYSLQSIHELGCLSFIWVAGESCGRELSLGFLTVAVSSEFNDELAQGGDLFLFGAFAGEESELLSHL